MRFVRTPWILCGVVLLLSPSITYAQLTIFNDNFTGTYGTNWTTVNASGSGSGSFTTLDTLSVMQIDPANNSRTFARASYTGFPSAFNRRLTNNNTEIVYTFHMRRDNNLTDTNRIAFVLAASDANVDGAGVGYAVVSGVGGSTNIRLVSFSGGMNGTVTNIIGASGTTLALSPGDWANVRVTYDATTDRWRLFATTSASGSTSLPNPAFVANELGTAGGTVNTAHVSTEMVAIAGYHTSTTGTNNNGYFDNITISAVPEPTTIALFGLVGTGLVGSVFYRRHKKHMDEIKAAEAAGEIA